jgi:hypothetical protein
MGPTGDTLVSTTDVCANPKVFCSRNSKSISSLLQHLLETEHGVILETLPMSPGTKSTPRQHGQDELESSHVPM